MSNNLFDPADLAGLPFDPEANKLTALFSSWPPAADAWQFTLEPLPVHLLRRFVGGNVLINQKDHNCHDRVGTLDQVVEQKLGKPVRPFALVHFSDDRFAREFPISSLRLMLRPILGLPTTELIACFDALASEQGIHWEEGCKIHKTQELIAVHRWSGKTRFCLFMGNGGQMALWRELENRRPYPLAIKQSTITDYLDSLFVDSYGLLAVKPAILPQPTHTNATP